MAEKAPFQRIKIECKTATKPYDPGRILMPDPGNSELVNCYMKAAMNVAESRGYSTRYNTKHKYERIDGMYKSYNHGTVYIRLNGITMAQLESMVEFIHSHAEILYNITESHDMWRMMYDRNPPREHYP
jgi:hypothetical protein